MLSCTCLQNFTIGASLKSVSMSVSVSWNSSLYTMQLMWDGAYMQNMKLSGWQDAATCEPYFGHFRLSSASAVGTIRFAECDFLLVFYIDLTRGLLLVVRLLSLKWKSPHFLVTHWSLSVELDTDLSCHVPISIFCCTMWSQSIKVTDKETDGRHACSIRARYYR